MEISELKHVLEAALLAAGRPLSADELRGMASAGDETPSRQEIREAVTGLQDDYAERGIELVEVASGYRIQVRARMSPWLAKLWEIRPPRFSRALMETLAIIAYRQPVTRGDVEDVRGVTVTPNIIRSLLERGWVRVVGHRDVPGKPEVFGTTKEFLDYFGLKSLEELPSLDELRDFESFGVQLDLAEQGDDLPTDLPAELSDDADQAGDGQASEAADTQHESAVTPVGESDEPVPADADADADSASTRAATTVASLDDARDSAAETTTAESGEPPLQATGGRVVPLKRR